MLIHYQPNGNISQLSRSPGERVVRAPEFFLKQVEINPGVLNQYHVIDGVLRADSLMYLPKLRPWKKSLIQSDWVAAIAIDDQRLELLVNEDHVNGKLISTLKVYLERSDFLEESHFLKSESNNS